MYRYLCLLCILILIESYFARPPSSPENGLDLLFAARNCRLPYRWIDGECRGFGANIPLLVQHGNYVKSDLEADKNVEKNIINVPQNCPNGQEWINGQCRDVWIKSKEKDTNYNVVTAPDNCPAGQEWINGQCRDVWASIIDGLKNAKPTDFNINNLSNLVLSVLDKQSQEKSSNQENINAEQTEVNDNEPKNIISVPNQCPNGFRPDSNGICREIW